MMLGCMNNDGFMYDERRMDACLVREGCMTNVGWMDATSMPWCWAYRTHAGRRLGVAVGGRAGCEMLVLVVMLVGYC